MYGNEASLGAGVLSSGADRSTLYITTKFHQLAPGETVRESLKASLERLQVEYVDLFLMHTPMGWGEPAGAGEGSTSSRLREVWRECEDVKREGLARSVGVSNFRERELEEVMEGARIVPAVNQVSSIISRIILAVDKVIDRKYRSSIILTSTTLWLLSLPFTKNMVS